MTFPAGRVLRTRTLSACLSRHASIFVSAYSRLGPEERIYFRDKRHRVRHRSILHATDHYGPVRTRTIELISAVVPADREVYEAERARERERVEEQREQLVRLTISAGL